LLNLKEKNIKIFIAGHKGLVGSSVLRILKKKYINILVREKKDLNLLDKNKLDVFIKKNKFDLVIMCAAKAGGILANSNAPVDFLYYNLEIQNNVISSCYKNNVKNFIFLGSSCIYPDNFKSSIKESDLLSAKLEKTNEAYAIAKIAGLKMCEYISLEKDYNYKSIMPCNLYGYNDLYNKEKSHVIPSMFLKFHEAKMDGSNKVILWGNGEPLREFLFVDDLANSILYLINNWKKFIDLDIPFINIGFGKDITIKELAEKIKKITEYKGKIIYDTSKPNGTYKKLLNCEKINNFGWQPETSLDEGLSKTYNWFLKNIDNYRSEFSN